MKQNYMLSKCAASILIVVACFFYACDGDTETTTVADVTDSLKLEASISGTATVAESAGTVNTNIKLNGINSTATDLTLSYVVTGTATAGADYEQPSGSVVIAKGADQIPLSLTIIDDTAKEDNETIIITLSSSGLPQGISVAGQSVTITITDNDDENGGEVTACSGDNSLSLQNIGCKSTPDITSTYTEDVASGLRTIITNGIPNHSFTNQNPTADELNSDQKTYEMTASPAKANATTSVVNDGMPAWAFGVALNGVKYDPAPFTPFIFEDTNTGEYNFDWVFEPTNNLESVGLDCASAHVQPDGSYHYHGDPIEYANTIVSGLGDGTVVPESEVHIGWAADGYPIVYKYGKNASGQLAVLTSSYRLISGDRPGDGVSAPCGEYNGKYTNDYEYVSGLGDLDECNGIQANITIANENFNYYYVITNEFPVVPRCFSGTPNSSFQLGGGGTNTGGGQGGNGGGPRP